MVRQPKSGEWLMRRVAGWAMVGGVAGTGFEACARILHPVGSRRLDPTVTDERGGRPALEERSWRWAEVAARTRHAVHPLVQWRRLTDGQDSLTLPDG